MNHRPDCVHCRFLLRQRNGEYRCQQHNLLLHSPISLFCKQISLLENQSPELEAWFDEHIDPDTLDFGTLYIWIETHLRTDKKGVARFDSETIGLISAYLTWSAGTFWQVLRMVRQAKRDSYRQHGFELDE